jgi:hypothetical protein
MKKIFILFTLTILLNAKIDFKKHIDTIAQNDKIPLAVTNVSKRDVLHLRLEPSYKSKIIYHIPYDAKNLTTYDKDIVTKLGKNIWVAVQLRFIGGFYNGWVKARYIKLYEKYQAIVEKDLVVIYPFFLKAEVKSENWIHLYNNIGFEHYNSCDEREMPKLLDEFSRFDMRLKVYYSLVDVFIEDKNYDIETYKKVAKAGWFRPNVKWFAKKINLYGLRGYKNIIGAEGCGVNIYFFRIKGKILVIKEPFNSNPPKPKEGKQPPKNLKFSDKNRIMHFIIKNLRIF